MVVGEDSKCVLEGGGVLPPPELLASLPLKTGFNSATFLVQVPFEPSMDAVSSRSS